MLLLVVHFHTASWVDSGNLLDRVQSIAREQLLDCSLVDEVYRVCPVLSRIAPNLAKTCSRLYLEVPIKECTASSTTFRDPSDPSDPNDPLVSDRIPSGNGDHDPIAFRDTSSIRDSGRVLVFTALDICIDRLGRLHNQPGVRIRHVSGVQQRSTTAPTTASTRGARDLVPIVGRASQFAESVPPYNADPGPFRRNRGRRRDLTNRRLTPPHSRAGRVAL